MTAAPAPGPRLLDDERRRVLAIDRPHRSLLAYYGLSSLLAGPFFPVLLLPLFFRFRTMRYRFDAEGVTMRWGILFRREVSLTYGRIQDIHLTSNVLERWLGLAQVKLSTASGSAGAEMVVEGLREFELVRDFLYDRMRGAQERPEPTGRMPSSAALPAPDEVARALLQVSEDLRAVRNRLERLRDARG